MSYYEKGQTIKYKEDLGPTAVVLSYEDMLELEGLEGLSPRLRALLRERHGEFFAPKLVLKERKRDIELCQQTYDALAKALEQGLSEDDVALLLSTAAYDLFGPAGAHGGMSDRELPEGAIPHDEYWAALEASAAATPGPAATPNEEEQSLTKLTKATAQASLEA